MAGLTTFEAWWDRRWLAGVLLPLFVVVKAGRLVWWDAGETAEVLRHLAAESVIMLTLMELVPLFLGATTVVLWASYADRLRHRPGFRWVAVSSAALLVLVAPVYLVVVMVALVFGERLKARLRPAGGHAADDAGIAGDIALAVILALWAALLPRGLPLQELRVRESGDEHTLVGVVLAIDDREVHVVDRSGKRVTSLPRARVVARVRCREPGAYGSATVLNLVTGRARSVPLCPTR